MVYRDAWKAQSGLSRTEAKRRYISTLISTMHKYASPSPDARELVSELEFVWDQVKSNVPSSSSSSPLRTLGLSTDFNRGGSQSSPPKFDNPTSNPRNIQQPSKERSRDAEDGMRVLSPLSQSNADEEEEEEGEEFVDAPDSQMADEPPPPRLPHNRDSLISQISSISQNSHNPAGDGSRPKPRRKSSDDPRWRKRIESSLIKLTAEVAALREQLESRRLFAHTLRFRIFRNVTTFIWGAVKHLAINVLLLGLVLLWLRRKKDRRFEGAIRVLLGDAVAQVQRVGEMQLRNVKLPSLGGGGKRPN
jgi:hypothetical protein